MPENSSNLFILEISTNKQIHIAIVSEDKITYQGKWRTLLNSYSFISAVKTDLFIVTRYISGNNIAIIRNCSNIPNYHVEVKGLGSTSCTYTAPVGCTSSQCKDSNNKCQSSSIVTGIEKCTKCSNYSGSFSECTECSEGYTLKNSKKEN